MAVGLDLGLGDRAQLLGGSHDDPRHMRFQQPRDRQRVAGRLQRNLVVRAEAVGQDPQALRTGDDASRRTHAPFFTDRDLAEVQMHV